MDKEKSIEHTIESIKIIEKQIEFFENKKTLFFQKNKINYRIQMLEGLKEGLYKTLEYKIDNNK